jgi:hypothetical protein
MARIPLIDESDPAAAPDARAALLEAGAARGSLLNIHRALANRPNVLHAFNGLIQAAYRKDSTLKPQHGELAYLTATTVNNCFY